MESQAAKDRIAQDRKLWEDLKLKGTPTIYVDGRELDIEADESLEDRVAGELGVPPAPPPSASAASVPRARAVTLRRAGTRAHEALPPRWPSRSKRLCSEPATTRPRLRQGATKAMASTRASSRRGRGTSSRWLREGAAGALRQDVAVPIAQCRQRGARVLGVPAGSSGDRQGGARGHVARAGGGALQGALRRLVVEDDPARGLALARTGGRRRRRRRVRRLRVPLLPEARARARRALGEAQATRCASSTSSCRSPMHPHGEIAARAAIAAQAQGKFWEMHQPALRATGSTSSRPTSTGTPRSSASTSTASARTCSRRPTKERLDADRKLADDLQVQGTPTIFIDGREYDSKGDLASGSTRRSRQREEVDCEGVPRRHVAAPSRRGRRLEACGCFPTGRHYAGIAHLLRTVIRGLLEELAGRRPVGRAAHRARRRGDDGQGRVGRPRRRGRHRRRARRRDRRAQELAREPRAARSRRRRRDVHKITDDDVKDAPPFAAVAHEIAAALAGHVPAAYNAAFDRAFLTNELARAGLCRSRARRRVARPARLGARGPAGREVARPRRGRRAPRHRARERPPRERRRRGRPAGAARARARRRAFPRTYGALVQEQRRLALAQADERRLRWRGGC